MDLDLGSIRVSNFLRVFFKSLVRVVRVSIAGFLFLIRFFIIMAVG